MNATKHGFASESSNYAKLHAEEVESRLDRWRKIYHIRNDVDELNVKLLAVESVRLDHCNRLEEETRFMLMERATELWDDDRALEAQVLASRLPKAPAEVAARLKNTKHGCELLADRWDSLLYALRNRGDWDDPQKTMALDALGIEPAFRSNHHLFQIDVPDPEKTLFAERESFAIRQSEELRLRAENKLAYIDNSDRDRATRGFFPKPPKDLATIIRYRKECVRRLDSLKAELASTVASPAPESDAESRTDRASRSSNKPPLKRRPISQEEKVRRASYPAGFEFIPPGDPIDRAIQTLLKKGAITPDMDTETVLTLIDEELLAANPNLARELAGEAFNPDLC